MVGLSMRRFRFFRLLTPSTLVEDVYQVNLPRMVWVFIQRGQAVALWLRSSFYAAMILETNTRRAGRQSLDSRIGVVERFMLSILLFEKLAGRWFDVAKLKIDAFVFTRKDFRGVKVAEPYLRHRLAFDFHSQRALNDSSNRNSNGNNHNGLLGLTVFLPHRWLWCLWRNNYNYFISLTFGIENGRFEWCWYFLCLSFCMLMNNLIVFCGNFLTHLALPFHAEPMVHLGDEGFKRLFVLSGNR